MNKKLDKALRQTKNKKQDLVVPISGVLGIPRSGQKLVEVPNRQGFVFVRLKNNTSELIQAYNATVSPIYDLPVLVVRANGVYKVIGRNETRNQNQWGQAPYLPKHGAQHSFNPVLNIGGDIVWVYSQQFMPLLGYPSGSAGSPQLAISPYIIQDLNGNWKYVGGTGTPDTTPYNPTTGSRSIMGLLYIDTVSGNPGFLINSGTYIDSSITGSGDIAQYIPRPNASQLPISAIRLVSGTSVLTWNNVYDVRPFLQVLPTGTAGGGGATGTFSWYIQDEGVPLGTANTLNVVGDNATISISGTVAKLSVSGLGWINVKDYGAVGNGITNDTTSITNAIAALPASGGLLYFPPGTYLTNGGFTLGVPCTVLGAGHGFYAMGEQISAVLCNSATAYLFTCTDDVVFRDISMANVAVSTPSTGAGIRATSANVNQRVDFYNIDIEGFYINVDIEVGCAWVMDGCCFKDDVKYGIKIQNTVNNDAGDWSIDNTVLSNSIYNSDAAIRIESSGGGKLTNIKVNGASGSAAYNHGIDITPSSATSGNVQISNCSIENVRGDGIHVAGSAWHDFIIVGCEFGLSYNTGNNTGSAIKITGQNYVIIADNTLRGGTSPAAISLTSVNHARLTRNINISFNTYLSQSSCTDVVVDNVIDVQDEGISKGFVDTFNFVGAGVVATVSGTVANVSIAGNTSVASQGIVVQDDGTYFASGTTISFDNNLYLGLSGTVIHVSSPVTTYQRMEQPISLQGGTGTLFQVPDGVYASGSLGVFYNGVLQLKGSGYEELLYVSGTYQLLFSPTTGSNHMVSYGVPCIPQTYIITGSGSFDLLDSDLIALTDSDGIQLTDSDG